MNELEEKLGGKSEMKFPIGRDSWFLYLLFFSKMKIACFSESHSMAF